MANSPAAMPEQIRQLLARAVAAMDRNDPSASLQFATQAGDVWQAAWQSEPAVFSDLETAAADVA
ncbi:MAG: hypothetical protein ACKON9_22345, partial [Planctomycetaceae bacterium]